MLHAIANFLADISQMPFQNGVEIMQNSIPSRSQATFQKPIPCKLPFSLIFFWFFHAPPNLIMNKHHLDLELLQCSIASILHLPATAREYEKGCQSKKQNKMDLNCKFLGTADRANRYCIVDLV